MAGIQLLPHRYFYRRKTGHFGAPEYGGVMCGRYALDQTTDELIGEYVATGGDFRDWRPDWNVAPTDTVPLLHSPNGQRQLTAVRWGIVSPSSPTFGGGKPIINARVETVATNGLFRQGFAHRRCIVPALGYYEWQVHEGAKKPYFITKPGEHLAFAGVMSVWRDRSVPETDPLAWRLSMAIITTEAQSIARAVHHRMPAFLTPNAHDDWLGDHLSGENLLGLLDMSAREIASKLEYYEVSRDVNSVRNRGSHLIAPLSE